MPETLPTARPPSLPTVVAFDMRGYNESERPEGVQAYRMAQLAADVDALVRALGHTRCTLVAHDWGGCVAWVVSRAVQLPPNPAAQKHAQQYCAWLVKFC